MRNSSQIGSRAGAVAGKVKYYGLILFFILEYVRPGHFFPALNMLHLNSLVPASVFLASFLGKQRPHVYDILSVRNTKLFLFFIFLIFVSLLTADVTLYSFEIFKAVFGYFLIYYVICKEITSEEKLQGLLKTLIFVHVAVLLLSPQLLINFEGGRNYVSNSAFLGDGNDFALSVSIIIPFCIYFILNEKSLFKKIFYALIFLFLVAGIIATSSRGGTLALSSALFYFLIKSEKKVLLASIFILFGILVLTFAPPTYFERIRSINEYQSDGSAQGRLLAWESGIRMAADHPILGVGAGHFPVKYGVEYRPSGYGRTDLPWATAHSIYFVILGELGLPGLFFLLYIIFSNIKLSEKITRAEKANTFRYDRNIYNLFTSLGASIVAFAVGGAFLTAIYYPHLYVLAALFTSGNFILSGKPLREDLIVRLDSKILQRGKARA